MRKSINHRPFTHVKRLQIGHTAARNGFRCHARGGHVGSVLHAAHYCDDFAGLSGEKPGNERVVAHLIRSGRVRFENETSAVPLDPGRFAVRDTSKRWRFWFGPATRTWILVVPRNELGATPSGPSPHWRPLRASTRTRLWLRPDDSSPTILTIRTSPHP
jgi:hypothetical protein